MTNKFFPDEQVTENDLYFLCYMIERVARKLHQKNKYVVNSISKDEWERLISLANVLHCENPMKIEDEWIEIYGLEAGDFDITMVDHGLVEEIPSEIPSGQFIRLEMTSSTWEMGMAYPMPSTSVDETLAVLMPMSSPSILSRAPPLLPGLMAASVWI